jgi:hypothetical protein
MTDFLKKLNKSLEVLAEYTSPGLETSIRFREEARAKGKLLTEQRAPQQGIYYWFPYGDNQWKLYPFWTSLYGLDKTVHPIIWNTFLARELAAHWGKLSHLVEIKGYYCGLPRVVE